MSCATKRKLLKHVLTRFLPRQPTKPLPSEKGEFEVEGVGKFQLQRTEVFDFADYHKYQQEQAVKWRENAKEKVKEQNLVKARTAVMNGYVKTFVELYPDKEPDEVKLTVKVIE